MARATQIGLIVLQADETIERDMRALLPANVEYLVSRVPSDVSVSLETLQAMEAELTRAASLLPRGARLAAVGYGCTSGTAQIGAERIAQRVRAGVETPEVSEPVSALIAACRALGVCRIGMVSPYVASVSDRLCAVLADAGVRVTAFESFDEPIEEKVVRIPAERITQAAERIAADDACEAVFLSCTNLRTLDVIAPLEVTLGLPVLSSNQVLAWHLGQLVGFETSAPQAGQLFELRSED